MTIKPDRAEVCWEPIDLSTGVGWYHDDERWPHYSSRAKCAEQIAEIVGEADPDDYDGPLRLVAKPCFDGPCVQIVCDGCGVTFDYENDDSGMHFDPDDPMPVPITECEWSIEERAGLPDRHYCPDCVGEWCDNCDDEKHHGDCPDPNWRPVPVTDGQLEVPW